MLCSRLGDTWQIGTASIREDLPLASVSSIGTTSDNVDARKDPQNNPTVRVHHQHLEDELARAEAGKTTREGAQNL